MDVTKKFFIMMDLPYSIRQSEKLVQRIFVVNNAGATQVGSVFVAINKDDVGRPKFSLLDYAAHGWTANDLRYSHHLNIAAELIGMYTIVIKPQKSGLIPIKVDAFGSPEHDAIEKVLLVIPEGIERVITKTELLLKEGRSKSTDMFCEIPVGVDPDTVSTEITFVGDLLGDALKNIDILIGLPSGCGEQNLARFAIAVSIHHYLTVSNQLSTLSPSALAKIERHKTESYQKHMSIRRNDGSYIYFYSSNRVGSTWLTAFTVRIFRLARSFITIDQMLIDTAFEFILSKQKPDGSFSEHAVFYNYANHGGLRGNVAIAAYISILLSESLREYPQYVTSRDRALNYVLNSVNPKNAYELAMTCYALHLADHPSFNEKYQVLVKMAVETKDTMYWNVESGTTLNVETVAYALLFINKFDTNRAIKLAKYLITKKTASGGWASTQDTVMALEALASVAPLITVYDGILQVKTWTDGDDNIPVVIINKENQMTLQKFDLDPKTREVTITAKGTAIGKVIVSFTCRYYEKEDNIPPRFNVQHTLLENCNTPLQSQICLNYIPSGADKISNMVIMRMTMPSGYVYDPDTPLSPLIRVSFQNSKLLKFHILVLNFIETRN